MDNTARVWSAANGRLLAKLEGHISSLHDCLFKVVHPATVSRLLARAYAR